MPYLRGMRFVFWCNVHTASEHNLRRPARSKVFDTYEPGPFFDELIDPEGTPRPGASGLAGR